MYDNSFLCFDIDVDRITKYGNNDRLSQEKTMHKPVPQHLNNTGKLQKMKCDKIYVWISGRLSSEPETNGSSPPTLPYQQGDKYDDCLSIGKTTCLLGLQF